MKCPKCKHKTKVINSRPIPENKVYRRRACLECEHRFTTYEVFNPGLEMFTRKSRRLRQVEKITKDLRDCVKELSSCIE